MTPEQLLTAAKKAGSPDTRRKFMARYKHAVKTERLSSQIHACEDCAYEQGTKRARGWEGPTEGNLALRGDSRGSFIGPSGVTLNMALSSVSLGSHKIFRFYPLCEDHHQDTLELVNPLFVATMGYQPIRKPAFLDGRFWFDIKPVGWYRRRNDLSGLVAALTPIAEVVNGWAELPLEEIPDLSDVTVSSAIEAQGWAKIYSAVIGDTLIATDREPSMLPKQTFDYPVYTLNELGRIRMLAGQKKVNTRELRAIHEIKKVFRQSAVIT